MKLPPIDDVIKALEGMGLGPDDIAKTIANMGFNSADNVASKVDEVAAVIPKVADRVAEVAPKLIPEGEALPATKISNAKKTSKFVRPKFDDVVHAKTTQKFSDIMSQEEYTALPDDKLKFIRNSELNKANNEELRLAGRAKSEAKSAANKAAHAETRTPEARRKVAAGKKAYFDKMKKEDK